MLRLLVAFCLVSLLDASTVLRAAENSFALHARSRVETAKGSGRFHAVTRNETWRADQTAVIVCDMWDAHHCLNAVRRVKEMAPRMNEFLVEARDRGALVIHAPSSCTNFYKDHPGRKRAQAAPRAANLPADIGQWCNRIPAEERGEYPIDQSDGGEDDDPAEHAAWAAELTKQGRNPRSPWARQIDVLEIHEQDAISDSGVEIWNLLESRGIKNVILLGVHTNMCVLGRPFGLRQMAKNGKRVVLVRDLTDTMYNPQMRPYVSHFTGTDLIVEHIEKYICPSMLSSDLLGGAEFRFKNDRRKHLAMVLAEDEYHTVDTLPAFAAKHLGHDFRVTKVFADARDRNNLVGIAALADADLALLSVRRRTPPAAQLAVIRKFIESGKPIVGVRTASHAFSLRNQQPPAGLADWPAFDREVLGCNYNLHHPQSTTEQQTFVWTAPGAAEHPVLRGVRPNARTTEGTLYRSAPLAPSAKALVLGRYGDAKPHEPVAWTNQTRWDGRVFYTSLGHTSDFKSSEFQRMLLNGIYWAAGLNPPEQVKITRSVEDYRQWTPIAVPGTWDEQSGGALAGYDGFAWYRCLVKTPAGWKGRDLELFVEKIDNAHEAYFNGKQIGAAGGFPPNYASGLVRAQRFRLPAADVASEGYNVVALRVFDHDGRGGFKGAAPALYNERNAIDLTGDWQLRTGDDPAWAAGPLTEKAAGMPVFATVADAANITPRVVDEVRQSGYLSPPAAAQRFTVADDLEWGQVLAEPVVRQPLSISFDERGRMWVVEYLQYPHPAGLKMVSRDNYWRAVYDKTPVAPPNHVRGKDKITIHEDTNGDGAFDKHTTFVDGLNIATSVARGRGGVWVLNPPYLLFYPDANDDDVPDGDPVVHLAGFGLEDTHSVANSLRWGPDGWLYSSQGSTVTGAIVRPGIDKKPQHSMGQLIWRYHPESRRYEVFAEGGGNAFGVEFDAVGRIYSGHNGGDTRGFHYVQGGYYKKGFGKHGPLSNPYAFGYFPAMKHHSVPRFTHTFLMVEGAGLPAKYRGNLLGVEPLQGQIVHSEVSPDGSSRQTKDLSRVVTSDDAWFRPVDIKEGPDGAVYVADWYDAQVNHYRNHEGKVDPESGRIYRLQTKGAKAVKPRNLAKLASRELVDVLAEPNKTVRQTAQRLLGDRRDAAIVPLLGERLRNNSGQVALEMLWALNLSGGFDDRAAAEALHHADPYVRQWAVRLVGDRPKVAAPLVKHLVAVARREPHVEVRSQLASTTRRLPADDALAIVAALAMGHDDSDDVHIPLLVWWAIEAHCEADREAVLKLFSNADLWRQPLIEDHITERLMRRYAQAGTRRDLLTCAKLLDLAPTDKHAQGLLLGFDTAFKGRSLAGAPDELIEGIARRGGGSLALRLRRGESKALNRAMEIIADPQLSLSRRIKVVKILGEVRHEPCIPALLKLLEPAHELALRNAALAALGGYQSPEVGQRVVELFPAMPADLQFTAGSLMATRAAWSRQLLAAVESQSVRRADIPRSVLRQMLLHGDAGIDETIEKQWGKVLGQQNQQMQADIKRYSRVIDAEPGSPYRGKPLFVKSCGKCHRLFGEGGKIGPDLTTFKRDDLPTMLLSVVNPAAQIREGFEAFQVQVDDGRVLMGFIADQDNRVVVIRGADGRDTTVARDEIEEFRAAGQSVMPEGLLKQFNEQQIRDLFAYLRSTQPLNN